MKKKASRNAKKKGPRLRWKPTPAPAPAAPPKNGRPSKFEDRFVGEAFKFSSIGLSLKDMAYIWSVDQDTITNWKDKYPAFSDALKRGDAHKRYSLLQAMSANAILFLNPTSQIFLAKNWLGMKDRRDVGLDIPTEPGEEGRVILQVVHTRSSAPVDPNAGKKTEPPPNRK